MGEFEIGLHVQRLEQRLAALEVQASDLFGRLSIVEQYGARVDTLSADLAEAAADLAALAAGIAEAAAEAAEEAAEEVADAAEGEGAAEEEAEGEGAAADEAPQVEAPVVEIRPRRESFLTRRIGRAAV